MTTRRRFPDQYITLAARVLGVLSHKTRLKLVLTLAQGPATVTELCKHLGLVQSNASHHLSILRNTALVADERDGQHVTYRLNVDTWRRFGDGFFDQLIPGENAVRLQHFVVQRRTADA